MPSNPNDVPTDVPVPPTTSIEAAQVNVYKHNLQWPLAPWQTRLTKLLPGLSTTDDIDCELHVVDLIEDNGVGLTGQCRVLEYEALSYSWGRPERTMQVRCNGILLLIPPGLHEALSALRLPDRPLWLWCDALCINQEDPAEKSVQVQKMLQIFRKASRVRAWLGQMNPERQIAFDLMKSLPELGNDYASYENLPGVPARDIGERSSALRTMANIQWFRRTWVRQEVWANSNLTLKCGLDEIPFTAFVALVNKLEAPPYITHLIEDYHHLSMPRSEDQKLSPQIVYCDKLRHLLRTGRTFEASDDRDRINGLLGMLQDRMSVASKRRAGFSSVVPDYTISVSQTYQRLVKFCINTERNLACLEGFGIRYRTHDIPSWAIDWRPQSEDIFSAKSGLFSVKGKKSTSPPPVQSFHDEGRLLLKGTILGIVSTTLTSPHMLAGTFASPEVDEDASHYDLRALGVPGSDAQYNYAGCFVPTHARTGDLILLLDGSRCPFVVRSTNDGQYRLIGRAAYWTCNSRDFLVGHGPSSAYARPTVRYDIIYTFSVWLKDICQLWDFNQQVSQRWMFPPVESSAMPWMQYLTRVHEVHRIRRSDHSSADYYFLLLPSGGWGWRHVSASRAQSSQSSTDADTLPQQEFVIV